MARHTELTLSSETVFTGRVFTVTVDEARLENGRAARREVVHHSGGAGIVAVDEEGRVVLARQYRYAAGREQTEIPAGKLEPGEDPRSAAMRELAEEAGLVAARFEDFGSVVPTCAYCTEVIHLYLATRLSQVPQRLDADEFLDILRLPLAEAVRWVMDGRIADAKSVSGILRAHLLASEGKLDF